MEAPSAAQLHPIVKAALEEDLGTGDVTTLATVPENVVVEGRMVARESLVLAGISLAELVFLEVSRSLKLQTLAGDGDRLKAGQALLTIAGPARAILSAERVALNFVQRLSGIATFTSKFVDAIKGTRAQILDTRKTTPGWRLLEKYAVVCGGGRNHRFGLYDLVLIKDNHLAALKNELPNPIVAAVRRARAAYPHLRIEVEVDTLEQVSHAIAAGADMILLDNMPPELLRQAVDLVGERAQTEASGGIGLGTVRAIAETGVNFISIGALTHSARAVDIALDL